MTPNDAILTISTAYYTNGKSEPSLLAAINRIRNRVSPGTWKTLLRIKNSREPGLLLEVLLEILEREAKGENVTVEELQACIVEVD